MDHIVPTHRVEHLPVLELGTGQRGDDGTDFMVIHRPIVKTDPGLCVLGLLLLGQLYVLRKSFLFFRDEDVSHQNFRERHIGAR